MGQTVLSKYQKKALTFLKEQPVVTQFFYLSGGTALAEYYLWHRYSEDFDFFTDKDDFPEQEVMICVQELKTYVAADEVILKRIHDRRIFFLKKGHEELKVEFTYYPFKRIGEFSHDEKLNIDSLEDIAANKIQALMNRLEPKDFVDIYYIAHEGSISFSDMYALSHKKFGLSIDPVTLGSEYAKVRLLRDLPRMIKPLTLKELKDFFTAKAKELRPSIIDT